MPGYARKSGNRKRYRRRRPGRFKKYRRAGLQLYRDVRKLKNFINTEFGYSDGRTSTSVNTGGQMILLNGLATGNDAFNREGRQVRFKSLQLKLTAGINASATDTRIRWILFIDKSPNATQPTAAELLALNTQYVDSYRNLNFRKRFVILQNTVQLLDTSDPQQEINIYRKIDLKTVYNASDVGTIADIESNALYVFVVSDEATNSPNAVCSYRIRFIDN